MRLLGALCALAFVPVACAAGQSPEAEFAAQMIAQLRTAMPGAELSTKADEPLVITLKGGDWGEGEINLHRIYGYCQRATTEECESSKQEFVAKISKTPPKASIASLRLIVRDQQYIDYLNSLGTSSADNNLAIFRSLGGDLYVILASDSADAIASVGNKTLKELGITADDAWAIATRQTQSILPPLPLADQLKNSAVAYQDQDYLGSLLVDTAAWAKLAAAVGPNLFVTVVSDQFVFVGSMPDGPKLDGFKKTVADDCAAQQRCISPHIYRFRNGQWAVAN